MKKAAPRKTPPPRKKPAGAPPAGELVATVGQLADALEIHRNTISKLIRDRGIDSVGKIHGRLVYSVRDLLRETRKNASGETDLNKLSPFERDAMTRSIQREDEIRRRRRELLDALEVEAEFTWYVNTIVHVLDTLPDAVERDTGCGGRIVELIENSINRLRQGLYERLTQWRENSS